MTFLHKTLKYLIPMQRSAPPRPPFDCLADVPRLCKEWGVRRGEDFVWWRKIIKKLFRIIFTKSKKSQQSKISFYVWRQRVLWPCPCGLRQTKWPLKSSDRLVCIKRRSHLWQASGSNSMNERLKHGVLGGERPFFRPKYVKNGNCSLLFGTTWKRNPMAFI